MGLHALIVAGGKRPSIDLLGKYISKANFVVAADSGANALVDAKFGDLTVVGDLDSIKPETLANFRMRGVPMQKSSAHKDETDTMLAVDLAIEKGAEELTILGALGKRLDHQYANLQLLLYAKKRGLDARLVDEKNDAFLAKDINTFAAPIGGYISVFAISKKVVFKRSAGLAYALDGLTLYRDRPIGVSNEALAQKVTIEVKKGTVLIIKSTE